MTLVGSVDASASDFVDRRGGMAGARACSGDTGESAADIRISTIDIGDAAVTSGVSGVDTVDRVVDTGSAIVATRISSIDTGLAVLDTGGADVRIAADSNGVPRELALVMLWFSSTDAISPFASVPCLPVATLRRMVATERPTVSTESMTGSTETIRTRRPGLR